MRDWTTLDYLLLVGGFAVVQVIAMVAAHKLGHRFGRWLERREQESLAHFERFQNDPEYALAYVRKILGEPRDEYERGVIAQLEQRAQDAAKLKGIPQ